MRPLKDRVSDAVFARKGSKTLAPALGLETQAGLLVLFRGSLRWTKPASLQLAVFGFQSNVGSKIECTRSCSSSPPAKSLGASVVLRL